MVFAYKVYILPILEYCSTVWSPFKLCDIDRIESIQRSFTKRLNGLQDLSYTQRLSKCNLPSLELRRLWADLTLCYKIIHNKVDLCSSTFFTFDDNIYSTRGNCLKLKIPNAQSNHRRHFFANRVCRPWNALPNKIVTASSVPIFKKYIELFDFTKFLQRAFQVET
jgi:hypothetical protein